MFFVPRRSLSKLLLGILVAAASLALGCKSGSSKPPPMPIVSTACTDPTASVVISDDTNYMRHTMAYKEGSELLSDIRLDYKPVVQTRYEPMERKY